MKSWYWWLLLISVLGAEWDHRSAVAQGPGTGHKITSKVQTLKPNEELKWQQINVGEQRLYRLSGLTSSTSYEVKISYPGSMAASLGVKLVSIAEQGAVGMRRLLDTEKVMFDSPRGDQLNQFLDDSYIQVHIQEPYISWDAERKAAVLYNIKLAPVFLGIPLEVFPHGLCILLLIIVIVVITFRERPLWPASVLLNQQSESDKVS